MVGTDDIIRAIVAIARVASPVIINTARRHELAIKLLKKFNLDPDHPPADFTGVYQYALVEYGIQQLQHFPLEQLQLVLELFRQPLLHQAFRQAFDRNDPSLLLERVEDYIEGYALGDKIREANIDYQREIAQFSAIFMEIVRRTRTPAEVLEFRKIEDLHQKISDIVEELSNLNALEEIRHEIALLNQNVPELALPAVASKPKVKSAFTQKLRNWLEALYDFESYEVTANNYVEWIINIRARRGFDRIVVRSIEAEVTILDVKNLHESVVQQKADEGWLIAPRRISQAAVDAVENDPQLFCYTFDELIDEVADFSRYFDWLENEVRNRAIDSLYVPLACTKEEIDPITKQRIAKSRYDDRNGWIDRYINRWLDDPAKEHISILGEFGTGKTWFALHYAWETLKKYRIAKEEGSIRPRLPLVIPLRDYAKAVSVESLFSEFFFRKHEIGLPGYSAFEQLNRMGKFLLILDGFDEMAAKVDRQQTIDNFWQLAKVVVPGAKVILTCRSEHFPEAMEGRALLNAELKASTSNLTGEPPQFEVLEIEKLTEAQIRDVLAKRTTAATVTKIMENSQILDLARRPVMIELILEALPEIESGKPIDLSRIYLYAVQRKMERDIKTERTFTSMADKLLFLCELSWEMLSSDRMSLNFREFPDRIRRLFGSVVEREKDLDRWRYDMMGQTMLIRNAEGDYTPAHRSLLEFFVAYKFGRELGILAPDFTEMGDETGGEVSPELLSETFGKAPLTQAVLDLLLPAIDESDRSLQRLRDVVKFTKGKTESEVGYTGGNAATLLLKRDANALDDCDLSETVLRGADFRNASLRNVNFAGSNLENCAFTPVFGTVLCVAFSPDGKCFVTGDGNGDIYLWQTEGKPILLCQGHRAAVWAVAISPDGKTLVSGSDDGTIKIWEMSSGKCVKTLEGHSRMVRSIAISPDGKILASGSGDRTVKLWDLETENCRATLHGHESIIWSVAISTDGKTLASGSADRTVKLWDLTTGDCMRTLQGHTEWVLSVAIAPDSKTVVSGSGDETVKMWDMLTGECRQSWEAHTSSVWSVAISPDGKNLVSSGDRTVKVWDVKTQDCLSRFEEHRSRVGTIAIAPDGKTVLSGSADETVKLWDILTGECLTALRGYSSAVRSVAIAPDGKTLATGSSDRTVKLWDLDTGNCLKTLQGESSKVLAVAIAHRHLVAIGDSGIVQQWEIATGKNVRRLDVQMGGGSAAAFAIDGKTLATGSADRSVKLWDLATGDCVKVLSGHTSRITAIAIAIDGKTLASGTDDGTINLWDLSTGDCMKTLQGYGSSVWALAIAIDGKTLATGSDEGNIHLWDLDRGNCLQTLPGHSNAVLSLTFHPDGKRLISGSYDETIKVWELESGTSDREIVNKPYAGMNIAGAIGLSDTQKATLKALGAKGGE